jgi:glycosyltransferase involved in cell wall biosynthesis
VDGGSTDGTAAVARPFADHVMSAPRGRAIQMNAGAAQARGDYCYFCMPTAGFRPRRMA